MKTSSSIKRNYFRRPAIRQLVPDLKLLLAVLQVGCESHVGCWVPSGLADDAGLSVEACEGGLRDLARAGLVEVDQDTGEIFLTDFFRNNTFKGPQRGQQALADFRQVESAALRQSILSSVAQSQECGLSVEFLTGFVKNQRVKNQGKDQVEVKEKTTPLPPTGGVDLQEVVEAAIWWEKQAGKKVGPKFKPHIINRVKREGLNDMDIETIEAFKNHKRQQQDRFKLPELPAVPAGERYERQRAEVRAVLGQRQKIAPEQGQGA
ncbi:hypothetical protein MTYP_00678 [Methylophilaceae bacterium]|nr:hypothetical protein MTYP_00678 [Methylophilaceae bacterium]